MHEIRVSVKDHEVLIAEVGGTPVEGTAEHWTLTAAFDAEWDGLLKRVTFTCGTASMTLDYTDGVTIPWEVFVPGKMRFGFVGVGPDGHEVVRTVRMRDGVGVRPKARDMGRDELDATEDIVHAAKRRLDDLSQAVDEAQETVADAKRAVSECDDATAAAKSATVAAKAATDAADSAAKRAREAAETATTQAKAAESMAAKADRSAQDAEERSTEAAGYAREQADLAVSEARGELSLMLGDPTEEDMWLYATGQADGVAGTPALDNAADEEMMGYVRGEV